MSDPISTAIAAYGAAAVFQAADDAMAGNGGGALAAMGVPAATLGDVWRAMRAAERALPPAIQSAILARDASRLGYADTSRKSHHYAAAGLSPALRHPL